MGEIAEMMLDGTLCQSCGVYIGQEAFDCPRYCSDCKREAKAEAHAQLLARHQTIKKVPCPTCGKKVTRIGLADHQRDAHKVAHP